MQAEKVAILPSICLGCVLHVSAFRDERDREWSSLYITELSNHSYVYRNSWRGRIRAACDALRGKPWGDIGCETLTEMKALHAAIGEMIAHCEDENAGV